MLLALDVGNTNVTAGVFSGARLAVQARIVTRPDASAARLAADLRGIWRPDDGRIRGAVYGSVVPRLNAALERAVRAVYGVDAIEVGPLSPLGIRLRVKRPAEVGADRVLNALGAAALVGAPAVVIDFGTATTFDCVARSGDYLGGAILPGPNMAAEALSQRTAKLPLVPVARPRRVIGRDTVECIQAGLYFGYLGMIEKVLALTVKELRQEGETGRPRVVATGGLSALFARDLPAGVVRVPDLTLQGLRLAHERLAIEGYGKKTVTERNGLTPRDNGKKTVTERNGLTPRDNGKKTVTGGKP